MWDDGLGISSLLQGRKRGNKVVRAKREDLAWGRELGRGASRAQEQEQPTEGSECTTLMKRSIFMLSNMGATSPVVVELLTCG